MPRLIHNRSTRTRWWPSLVVGATLGAIGVWLVLRSGSDELAAEGAEPERPRTRGGGREPDLDALNARVRSLAGAEALRLRSLGGGILELVGSAAAGLDVRALLKQLAAEPRVSVVVNRVWTPDSMDPVADLNLPGPTTEAATDDA